jgi:hypothetical protein
MVRKKRKGVVKEADAEGASAARRPRVDLELVLRDAPLDAALPFALAATDFPVEAAQQVETLARWYHLLGASRDLFDQLKVLQLFRSKVKALLAVRVADECTVAFATAAWRLVFRLYVTPECEPLRKNFFLILDALAAPVALDTSEALRQQLEVTSSEEMRLFLDKLLGGAQQKAQTPDEIVATFDAMLLVSDFPFLARVLVETAGEAELRRFVDYSAQHLTVLAEPVTRFQQNASSSDGEPDDSSATSVVLVASERCGHALKNVILLTTMKDALYQRATQPIVDDFMTIAQVCAQILQTSVVHKDLLTQAALAYCLVIRLLLFTDGTLRSQSVDDDTVAKQLLSAAYPGQKVSLGVSPLLRARLEEDPATFGELSRLAVFRGALNSLADNELLLSTQDTQLCGEDGSITTIMDALFKSGQQFCQHESLNVRLYAFQVLEAFLRRAVLITQNQAKEANATGDFVKTKAVAYNTLASLTSMVLLNWEHPSKKVNQFMPPMFTHIVNYFVLTGDFDGWKKSIVAKLVSLPSHSRAKYGALSIVADKYGIKSLRAEYPSLMLSVLVAVGHKDVLSAAVASLFSQLFDAGAEEDAAMKRVGLADVAHVLVSEDAVLRARVAMYIMPLLLKKNPAFVVLLIDQLRATLEDNKTTTDQDTVLWAIIEVVKYARKKFSPEKLVGLSFREVEQGLGHQQAEIRGSAFEAICASLKSTNTPTPEELSLIKTFLVMSSKEVTAGSRMNTMIGLKNVFFRIKETLRLARKQNGGTVAGQTQPSNDKALALSFKRWVQQFVITSVYPGASPQRTILGLEVMLLYLQVFGLNEDSSEDSESLFLRPQVVSVLLNVLVSSWDIVRSLAFSILDLYPTDLPGYTTHGELISLLNWALKLCVSPRQRESDAGALFMRVIFKRSVSIQRFGVVFDQENGRDADSAVKDSDVSFVLKLTAVVLRRLHDCEKDRSRQSESPLVHGLLLALRYIVESVEFEKIASDKDDTLRVEWQTGLRQVFLCIDKAMQASLSVVGDATSGVGDEELSANFAGVVGEVSAVAKSATPALKVDCRGHLIIEDNGDEEEYGSDSAQRAVVGSWLAARECGAIMDTLMKRVPLPVSDASKETKKTQFFTTEMAQRGGEMLLNSLFELKHKGAVAMAYQSFEGVCKAFLAHAERNTVLGGLPRVWADRLLTRLETSQQVFILRRSSGFAFSFVSILRAEPRNSAAVILPLVMSNLLRLASLDTDSVALTKIHEDHHMLWRSRVHALNILKLICQDAVLADDVSVYVSRMLEVAIFGFDCESWAVRNSSMMLFAATTQRAVGDKRIADNATSRKVSSTDVFSRFPQLSEFLHRELVRFTAVANSADEATESTRGTTPPGLFPILMLLSRLKPGEDDDAHALVEGVHLSDMVPSVMQCAAQPTMAIRQMAAKVLAAIVRDADALSILQKLCAELPNGVFDPASASAQSTSTTPKTNNYVHGVLSQIHQLARRYLDGSADASVCDTQRLFAELVVAKVVGQKLWLINTATSPAIRAELLQIVDVAVKFCESRSGRELAADVSCAFGADLRPAIAEIEALCARELTERCAVPSSSSPYYRQHHDPGMYVVDRTLVSIFFGLWRLESTCNGAEQKARFDLALRMLTSPVLQVRKRSIKQLSNLLTRFESANKERVVVPVELVNELQSVLATQLLVEVHPKIKVRILHLMVHYEEKQPSRLSDGLARKLMTKIVFILENVADADVVAPALELLALLSSQYRDDVASMTLLRDQIVLRADEKQPLVLRRAAAKALQHCDVLSLTGVRLDTLSCVQVAVDCWLSAITLLQDDDANTRRLANAASVKGLTSQSSVPEHSRLSDTLALPLAIEHVVVAFGSTEYGSSRLLKMLEALIDAPTELQRYLSGAASKDLGAADLSSRIFEAESDNYFAESDLVAQNLAFQMLHKHRRQLFNASDACDTVVTAALSALSLLEQASNTGSSGNDWLGGASFYPGVFPALQNVAMAAAAAAFSVASEDGGVPDWAAKLRLLAQKILANSSNGYPLHPLAQQALQVLAAGGDDEHGMPELLYLTPFWNTLKA